MLTQEGAYFCFEKSDESDGRYVFSHEFSITQSPSIQDCPVQNGIQVDNSSSPCLNLCFALGSLKLEVIEESF